MNIHDHMDSRLELAKTFAKDGGFHTAARILRNLANDLAIHSHKNSPHPASPSEIIDLAQKPLDALKSYFGEN